MFGDASGAGFGQTSWEQGNNADVEVEFGLWKDSVSVKSSNFRELANHVNYIERKLEAEEIKEGSEIFLFTDNFVAERCFTRGNSASRSLFELMLRLRELQMDGRVFIRLIWVAGTRMIEQGTDGASRGDLSNGVMAGRHMLDFVPLNKGVDV